MPDLRSEFWAPRRERLLRNADRRDMLEMMAGQARYFDRVYGETFAGEEPDLTRAEFVTHALGLFDEAGETVDRPLERVVLGLFGGGGELLADLDPDHVEGWLWDLEEWGRLLGEGWLAMRARVAKKRLAKSRTGTDVALTVLLQLRELVRLLIQALIADRLRSASLKLLAFLLAETFGEEEASQVGIPTEPEHGPPRLVLMSAVQPHAPPECFFSAPRGESVEMRLDKAREGLMAA